MPLFSPDENFDHVANSLSDVATRTRLFAFLNLAKKHGHVKTEEEADKFIKKGGTKNAAKEMDQIMHLERAKKVVLDFFGKKEDDNCYNLNVNIVNSMIDKMSEEIWTVNNIKKAAKSDDIEMCWDDELQDFAFKKKGVKNG
jgi:hypothetical protein